jgi:Zn-dependent protease
MRGAFMNENVELGRASGIKVSLNWSLLVAFWLIAWSLAEGVFPSAVPGYSSFGYWVAGIACATLFLATLVVHEMGHSVVARYLGVRVDRITLWLFGGVSRLTGEARTPASEMRIAAIGPVVSLGIAGVCGVFVVLMGALGGPSRASTSCQSFPSTAARSCERSCGQGRTTASMQL